MRKGLRKSEPYHWVVADAVICEPVSYDNSLLTGKFTGNLAISDRFGRDVIEKIAVPQ